MLEIGRTPNIQGIILDIESHNTRNYLTPSYHKFNRLYAFFRFLP